MKPRLVIVGAGPAGVSAALWARERFAVVVLERAARAGGQLRAIHFVPPEMLGNDARKGDELADLCERQLAEGGIETKFGVAATALEARAGAKPAVRTQDGARLAADAVLIASGLRRRRLGVPGEAELEGRGVSTSGTRDFDRLAGRVVLVVGGGDAAFENALRLAEAGSRVALAVRGRPRARPEFRARVAAAPGIEILRGATVAEFVGGDRLESVRLAVAGRIEERPFDGAVIKIGAVPNSEWCARDVRTDRAGFVRATAAGRTSTPGVWAAGDIVRPALFAIPVAEAGGALAVLDAARRVESRAAAPNARPRPRRRPKRSRS